MVNASCICSYFYSLCAIIFFVLLIRFMGTLQFMDAPSKLYVTQSLAADLSSDQALRAQ